MKIDIIDNSGATLGRVIKILNKKSELKVGDLCLVSILSNIGNSKIRKGQIFKAVLVLDKKVNSFGYNISSKKGLILVKTKKNEIIPIGTRTKGFMCSKLKTSAISNRLISITKKTI